MTHSSNVIAACRGLGNRRFSHNYLFVKASFGITGGLRYIAEGEIELKLYDREKAALVGPYRD